MSKHPIAFIHGIKGGYLSKKSNGERAYFGLRHIFCLQKDDLSLPMGYEPGPNGPGPQERGELISGGIIETVKATRLGPRFADVYGEALDNLQKHVKDRDGAEAHDSQMVFPFAYDWRRELFEVGKEFEAFLEDIVRKFSEKSDSSGSRIKVQVIAHSMGSSVTLPVLNRRPDLFHSVVFCAGALGSGAVSFVPDMSDSRNPQNFVGPFNKTLMTPSMWLTCPSVWHFFPNLEEQGRLRDAGRPVCFEIVNTEEEEGKPAVCERRPLQIDFHSLEDWKKMRIGPWHPQSQVDEKVLEDPKTEDFLRETFKRCKVWRTLIKKQEGIEYPPIGVIRGVQDTATLDGLCFERDETGQLSLPLSTGKNKNFLASAGDNRIPKDNALPPAGVPVFKVVESTFSHGSVPKDPQLIDLLKVLDKEFLDRGVSSNTETQI